MVSARVDFGPSSISYLLRLQEKYDAYRQSENHLRVQDPSDLSRWFRLFRLWAVCM